MAASILSRIASLPHIAARSEGEAETLKQQWQEELDHAQQQVGQGFMYSFTSFGETLNTVSQLPHIVVQSHLYTWNLTRLIQAACMPLSKDTLGRPPKLPTTFDS